MWGEVRDDRTKTRRSPQTARGPSMRRPFKSSRRGGLLKIIAAVWLHASIPTNGRSQPAAAPVRVAFAFAPFSSSQHAFGTARRRQGRAMWARRSEPLTARTVLESETGGKGGFPEPPAPATQHIPHTVSPASFDPSWISDFVSPPFALPLPSASLPSALLVSPVGLGAP